MVPEDSTLSTATMFANITQKYGAWLRVASLQCWLWHTWLATLPTLQSLRRMAWNGTQLRASCFFAVGEASKAQYGRWQFPRAGFNGLWDTTTLCIKTSTIRRKTTSGSIHLCQNLTEVDRCSYVRMDGRSRTHLWWGLWRHVETILTTQMHRSTVLESVHDIGALWRWAASNRNNSRHNILSNHSGFTAASGSGSPWWVLVPGTGLRGSYDVGCYTRRSVYYHSVYEE